MPQATSPLPFPIADEKRPDASKRLLDLREKLNAAWEKLDATRRPYDAAERTWFALRTRKGKAPADDSPETLELDRTEAAFHVALEERTNLIEKICEEVANSAEGLDVKVAVLQALLKEGKMEFSPSIGLSPPDKVAYSLARDVALIRGAL